jgi:peptide/nickel transport system substrate-binding protein
MHALKLHGRRGLSTTVRPSWSPTPSTARFVGVIVALAAASMAAGCFAPARPKDVVVYASGTDLESGNPLVTVHPLSRQVQRYALFVTLARYDSMLAPAPYGARAWEWSSDRRTLVFHLVPELRWHDGRPTTAGDVAFTLAAARDPATGYPRASDLSAIDTIVARDDSTAIVRFRAPQASFPLVLCELPILPSHLLSSVAHGELKRAGFNLEPIGNGPFKFVERRAGQRWVFARNNEFPASLGGPPRLAGVVVAVVDEPTTKFAGLASGDLDVAGIAPTMAALAARDPSLRVVDYPVLFTTGLVFNVHKPPFDDVRVRRAVGLAIDRERIVRAALAGYGRAAAGPVPPESPLAARDSARVDTLRADSLLDAAGWARGPDGLRHRASRAFTFDLLTVGSGDNAVEQLIQADLAVRGIRVEIRQAEMGSFLTTARAAEKRYDVLLTGVSGDVSLAYLGAMFESRQAGGALDYAGFHTPTLDSLFADSRVAPTDSARREIWRTVQHELRDQMPVAWLYHSRGVQGVASRLQNVVMDLRGEMVSIARWSIRDSAAVASGR